ncbi:MAG: Undecaprenyl-phosphate galactosephosphotransferase (EC [uncultured Sulfurovum sp.]|uniref:Undecaprenyl-phosphate galactosephosphotransferase (EC) n=1 Tax=uncultured Sulfurovum sp. TaxID=269237 RepID=A0A6S6T420_9BACT|nr:MAG: Undecaprenyl-phosphate galactosephosphotransferase (EC [uncultured Sulfurovum sp.]
MDTSMSFNTRNRVDTIYNISRVTYVSKYKKYLFNRVFDVLFSLGAILLFMPIMLIVALLIKINSPQGTILFKQKRLGLDGKLFYVYKFRTMVVDAEKKLEQLLSEDSLLKQEYLTFRKLKKDPRIIPNIGNFLRKSSLDELPQFFNVLLGDMSIVGPRPYIENEFQVYPTKLELKIVTAVKPGVTGYWQVIPERHETTFLHRVRTDIEYIEKKSFKLDLEIIAKTVGVMALRKGA